MLGALSKHILIGLRIAATLALLHCVSAFMRAEQLPIRTYSTADGLGSTFIIRIVRDTKGFLWFCTRDGLSRFDGHRFVTYTMEHGLPTPTINNLLETRDGGYWIATNGGGACRFHPRGRDPSATTADESSHRRDTSDGQKNLFTTYPVGSDARTNNVNILYEDQFGQVWAGTDGGLFRMEEEGGTKVFRRVEIGLPSHPDHLAVVSALIEDRQGTLWIGTIEGVTRRSPDGRMTHYTLTSSLGRSQVMALLADGEGRLWIGHAGAGLIDVPIPDFARPNEERMSDKHSEFPIPPSARHHAMADLLSNRVLALHQTADGHVWIGTHGGLEEFDGNRLRSYTSAQGLSGNQIRTLAEDLDGNLWMGSQNGAMKLTVKGFASYGTADGLGATPVHSIYEDTTGDVYAISGNWFVNRFDGNGFAAIQAHLPDDATSRWASPVGFLDRAGGWWMLTTNGLHRFKNVRSIEQLEYARPEAVYTTRDGLTGNLIFHLFEDSGGNVWISSGSAGRYGGLTKWERRTGKLTPYPEADGVLGSHLPTAFCEDRSGNLWIGFSEGGLARYTAGGFRLFGTGDGLPAGAITMLYLDRVGRLWIATGQSGLAHLDDPIAEQPRFVALSTSDGLSSNNIRCVTEDQWGQIYLGTVRGVDKLNLETGRIRHYSTADGLIGDFVTSALRDRRGCLWFGTMKGLSRLVPELEGPRSAPPILIGGLRIAGVRHPVSELGETELSGLELGPNQNQLQIDFFGLDFSMGEALRYQVKLGGGDTEWSAPTDQRTVNYASLSPGAYRFMVRAVSAEGAVSAMPATIAFRILPPVWRQSWFLTVFALLIGLAAYAIHRYRIARLLELERVRTHIAADLHDDIGSSLSQVSVLSEVARQQISKDDAPALEPLSRISRISIESMEALSDIVWAVNPQKDHVFDLTQRMRRLAGDIFTSREIEFNFVAPLDGQNKKIEPETRRQVFLIFKEGVNNIVRHASCTKTEIELRIEAGWLVLNLRDNGTGFEPQRDNEGNGLESMRARAKRLGGRLDVTSPRGEGTALALRVPFDGRGRRRGRKEK
ncbi:MAG TPA: two-component regulator propeller domain-containing protein [Blastocatellia bacterium]|nr:two-component regulator propeller domain-containing protein [Blastocatellia bacterium]